MLALTLIYPVALDFLFNLNVNISVHTDISVNINKMLIFKFLLTTGVDREAGVLGYDSDVINDYIIKMAYDSNFDRLIRK